MAEKLAARAREDALNRAAERFDERADGARQRAETIRRVLTEQTKG